MRTGNILLMLGASVANLRPEVRATDPLVADLVIQQEAVFWYNSTEKAYKFFNGTEIEAMKGSGGGGGDTTQFLLLDGSRAMSGNLLLSSDDQSAGADNKVAISRGHLTTALNAKLSKLTGAAVGVAVVTGADGTLAVTEVTADQLGFLTGVTSNIQTQLDGKLDAGDITLQADMDAGGHGITNLRAPANPTEPARLLDVTNQIASLPFQRPVISVQRDATLVPVANEGSRYIIDAPTQLNPAFGSIVDLARGDIVEYDVGDGVWLRAFAVSAESAGAIVWATGVQTFLEFNGTVWNQRPSLNIVAGDGIEYDPVTGVLAVRVGGALTIDDAAKTVDLKIDTDTIVYDGGLKVGDGSLDLTHIKSSTFGTGLKIVEGAVTLDPDNGFIKSGDTVASLTVTTLSTPTAPTTDASAANKKYVDDSLEAAPQALGLARKFAYQGTPAAAVHTIQHNLSNPCPAVGIYDENGLMVIPDSVQSEDNGNRIVVTLPNPMIIDICVIG